eukprot:4808291-Pyramimonas_sp.AAC.1
MDIIPAPKKVPKGLKTFALGWCAIANVLSLDPRAYKAHKGSPDRCQGFNATGRMMQLAGQFEQKPYFLVGTVETRLRRTGTSELG